jgi:hypothetical protein
MPPPCLPPRQVPVAIAFDQPLNAKLIVQLGCAPCALSIGSITAQALGTAVRRAAHPGPERTALLRAAGRAAGIICREAEGALGFSVRALESAWADWDRQRQQPAQGSRPALAGVGPQPEAGQTQATRTQATVTVTYDA